MSSDDGTFIVEREQGVFDTYRFQGESPGQVIAGNQNLKDALVKAIEQRTEYGLTSVTWWKKPRAWSDVDLLNHLTKLGGFTIETDNEGQLIIYTGLCENGEGYLVNLP